MSGSQVVTLEPAPEVAGLDADNRIRLRVERHIASEHFDCDRIGLDTITATRQRLLHHMAEEAALATGCIEVRAVEDPGKLGTTILWGEPMLPPYGWFRPDHVGSLT
ncbi:hypothetical protein [Mesorhizobium sp.]|uniref:hypothetical protein n=1 Tax=Mesorhizobium sp. TaxID=1871066 RepID=UPI00257FA527|nr:hypothetical protein [Mesorhizobium sp.]